MEYPADLIHNINPSLPTINNLQLYGNLAFEYAVYLYLDDNAGSSLLYGLEMDPITSPAGNFFGDIVARHEY